MSSKKDTQVATPPFPFTSIALVIALTAVSLAVFTPFRSSLSKLFASSPASLAKRSMATTTSTMSSISPSLNVTKRPWNARGHADHGWLYTFHTFSFASYHDPRHQDFGPLRVINEDRVERGTGFGTHSHAEFLIWSYIVTGELEHKDSMGNLENLRRGEVQFTSAGTGIRHSEYCRNEEEDVHFLQIWAKPYTRGLKPSYVTRDFTEEMKRDRLCKVMQDVSRHDGSEAKDAPIPLHADLDMSASILSSGKSVTHELVKEGRRNVYLHLTMSGKTQPKSGGAKIKVGDVELGEGDGAFVRGVSGPGTIEVQSVGEKPAEFLLFDMGDK